MSAYAGMAAVKSITGKIIDQVEKFYWSFLSSMLLVFRATVNGTLYASVP